jgi:peroxiredoxin
LSAFNADLAKFAASNAQVVGVNTDTVFSHMAFQKSLGGIKFPLATDRWPYANVAKAYGVFPPTKHEIPFVNDRAIFVVDKNGRIAWAKVYELRQTPDVGEVLEAVQRLK